MFTVHFQGSSLGENFALFAFFLKATASSTWLNVIDIGVRIGDGLTGFYLRFQLTN
jgi:hypothetical protein